MIVGFGLDRAHFVGMNGSTTQSFQLAATATSGTRAYGMNARSSGSIDVGVSKNGPGPSGSMVAAPSLAKNVAICSWAASAYGAPAPLMFVRNVCGFLLTAGFAANTRSLRKSVARDASWPARRIAVAVGFGTVLSPRANWMITGRVMNGATAVQTRMSNTE